MSEQVLLFARWNRVLGVCANNVISRITVATRYITITSEVNYKPFLFPSSLIVSRRG